MKNRAGFTLFEVMMGVLLLSLTVTVFASLFPLSARLRTKSENVTRATTLAQQKIEQVRALSYADLEYDTLRVANVIDSSPDTAPFSFTQIDGLATKLPQGAGTLTISDPEPDLRQVSVTVTWGGVVANGNTITVSTLIANKETYVK
jgi:Tfp pilus assembly protein PilV